MSDGLINLMLACLALVTFVTALSLLVIRRSAWIRSKKFDAVIFVFVAITIALVSFITKGILWNI